MADDTSTPKEGWGVLAPGTRRFHYYVNSMSLCRTRGFYFGPLTPHQDKVVDGQPQRESHDCKKCWNELQKRRSANA